MQVWGERRKKNAERGTVKVFVIDAAIRALLYHCDKHHNLKLVSPAQHHVSEEKNIFT
jgi:hypothetical protein